MKQTSISVCTPTQLSPYSKTEANQLRRKPQQQLAVSIGCLHVFGDLMNVGRVSQDLCLKDFIEHPIPPCLSMDTKDFHPSLLTGESGQTTRPPPQPVNTPNYTTFTPPSWAQGYKVCVWVLRFQHFGFLWSLNRSGIPD